MPANHSLLAVPFTPLGAMDLMLPHTGNGPRQSSAPNLLMLQWLGMIAETVKCPVVQFHSRNGEVQTSRVDAMESVIRAPHDGKDGHPLADCHVIGLTDEAAKTLANSPTKTPNLFADLEADRILFETDPTYRASFLPLPKLAQTLRDGQVDRIDQPAYAHRSEELRVLHSALIEKGEQREHVDQVRSWLHEVRDLSKNTDNVVEEAIEGVPDLGGFEVEVAPAAPEVARNPGTITPE